MKDVKELAISEFEIESMPLSCTWIIIGSPGSGKCFDFDTGVLMYDGTTSKAGNVKVGDLLMGDDFKPRKVERLFQGREKLYKISPSDSTEPYYVTGNHTLCLRYNTRPKVSKENGKNPRYFAEYAKTGIDISGGYPLSKVKQTKTSFSCAKFTEEGAKAKAESVKEDLLKKYDESFPLHEVEVVDYLKQSKSFNHRLVAYRSGVEFSEYKDQDFDPYLLGAWLGDGDSADTVITNIDKELVDYLYLQAEKMGMTLTRGHDTEHKKGSMAYYFSSSGSTKKGSNVFMNFLRNNNLYKNKHIPHNYKVNSRENRLALLAGLIDTDGHFGNQSFYEIYQKNETLANDIVFVARSLGFWCHIKPVEKGCMYKGEMRNWIYHKVTLGGDNLHEIPVFLPRKMAPKPAEDYRRQKDSLHYKFKITEDKEDDYYGFELSGTNHRFLLADFTVTHNCLAPNTPVRMFDDSVKKVQDIQTGELLMGDDFKPRKVLSVCSGEDTMYHIKQSDGADYTVNEPHILVLTDKNGNTIERETKDVYEHPEILDEYRGYSIKKSESYKNPEVSSSALVISKLGVGKYHGFQIDGNGRFLLGDYTVTHNTTLIENLCYYNKHKYPVARVFMGTEDGYKKFCKIFNPLYVSNSYDEGQERQHILRQKTCNMENGKGYEGNYAINILDDVSDDPRIYKTKVMRGLFKLGSQHWSQLLLIGSQYAIDMPPDIRKATSYVAIFREPEEGERKKLYNNFGGLAGSYQNFCDLMDQITGDYTCMVFKKRSQSNNIEDCIFYYKTVQLGPWKFGCDEYREHSKLRYDTNYVEKLTV